MCDVASAPVESHSESLDNYGHDAGVVDTSAEPQQAEEESPTINIAINNVVSSFSTRCHLNLRKIAMESMNVEFRKENGVRENAKAVFKISNCCGSCC